MIFSSSNILSMVAEGKMDIQKKYLFFSRKALNDDATWKTLAERGNNFGMNHA